MLEAALEGRDFVLGERATIADLSLCGYLYFPDEFGMSWAGLPHIAAWIARIAALPGRAHPYRLIPGHPLPGESDR